VKTPPPTPPEGQWFLSPWFRIPITSVAAVGGILNLAYVSWPLAVAAFVLAGSLFGSSWIIQFYVRQIWKAEQSKRTELESKIKQSQRAASAIAGSRHRAADNLHLFIHQTRDLACEMKRQYEALYYSGDDPKAQLIATGETAKRFFDTILNRIVAVFRPLVDSNGPNPVAIWAALREIKEVNGRNVYVTFARAGDYNPNREATSEPVSEDEGLPKKLREFHRAGKGIVIVPKGKPGEYWKPMRNDERAEDESVVAGPIILKGVSTDRDEMPMILYLNSPSQHVFQRHHEPYMKCCTDTVSMAFNILAEILLEVRDIPSIIRQKEEPNG